ncbi:hypothetical protein L916_07832, partial [Phytophthora nicotianae]
HTHDDGVKLESQVASNQTLEIKISVLKLKAKRALQALQAGLDEISEAESRAAVFVEERDAVNILLQQKQTADDESTAQREEMQK